MHIRFEAMVFVVAACTLTVLTAYVFFTSKMSLNTETRLPERNYEPSGDVRFVEVRNLPND